MAITKGLIEKVKHELISLHDRCIQKSGGVLGVLSDATLEFAIYDILRFSEKHKDPLLIAAYTYVIISTRHGFVDGNKRTSHIFAKQLLLGKKIHLKLRYYNACPFILKIADGNKTLKEIGSWLQTHTESFNEKDKERYLKELIYDIEHSKNGEITKNEK